MKCYFCGTDASGICVKCGRALCKAHGSVQKQQRPGSGVAFNFECKECLAGVDVPV